MGSYKNSYFQLLKVRRIKCTTKTEKKERSDLNSIYIVQRTLTVRKTQTEGFVKLFHYLCAVSEIL